MASELLRRKELFQSREAFILSVTGLRDFPIFVGIVSIAVSVHPSYDVSDSVGRSSFFQFQSR